MLKKLKRKVFRPIERVKSKVLNVSTFGLHNKTKKIRHKIIKSKAFKIAVIAVGAYFTAGALMGAMGMGAGASAGGGLAGAKAGLANAGSQLMAAGKAIAAGEFATAGSALKSGAGFGGAASAGAGAGSSGAVAGGGGTITANGVVGATAAEQGGLAAFGSSVSAPSFGAGAGSAAGSAAGGAAAKAGLLGLGEAGTAALITGGMQMGGSMLQGHAQQKAQEQAEEAARKRRNTWGAGEDGQIFDPQLASGGSFQPYQAPQQQWQPKTLDDLIKAQQSTVNNNSGLLWG